MVREKGRPGEKRVSTEDKSTDINVNKTMTCFMHFTALCGKQTQHALEFTSLSIFT